MRFIALIIVLFSCGRSTALQRWQVDAIVGTIATTKLQLTNHNHTLLNVQSVATELHLRAGAPTFSFTIKRLDPRVASVRLVIDNVPKILSLSASSAVFDGNVTTSPGLKRSALSKQWQVVFPQGDDQIEISTATLATENFSFLAMGDIQNGIDNFADVVTVINQHQEADFLLFLGDITMGSSREEFAAVAHHFSNVAMPIYSTPGNHDIADVGLYTSFFGSGSYSFRYRNVRFTSIDSAAWALAIPVWNKVADWFEQGKDQTHIVFSHIAPTETFGIRGGHWRSRREANRFIAMAVRTQVDAMFFGHLHTYDAYQLGGIPAYISGGAGAFEEELDGIGRHILQVNVVDEHVQVAVIDVER